MEVQFALRWTGMGDGGFLAACGGDEPRSETRFVRFVTNSCG